MSKNLYRTLNSLSNRLKKVIFKSKMYINRFLSITEKRCVIKNRVSACLENAELSDVTFFVGECENQGQPVNVKLLEKIPGHKLLLAIASPVFKAMFFGPMAEKDFVIITDISASVFKQVLR